MERRSSRSVPTRVERRPANAPSLDTAAKANGSTKLSEFEFDPQTLVHGLSLRQYKEANLFALAVALRDTPEHLSHRSLAVGRILRKNHGEYHRHVVELLDYSEAPHDGRVFINTHVPVIIDFLNHGVPEERRIPEGSLEKILVRLAETRAPDVGMLIASLLRMADPEREKVYAHVRDGMYRMRAYASGANGGAANGANGHSAHSGHNGNGADTHVLKDASKK